MSVYLLCPGINCPVKASCRRFREKINPAIQDHMAHTPYDHVKKKCGWLDKPKTDEKVLSGK
jgi:hypothetical protein